MWERREEEREEGREDEWRGEGRTRDWGAFAMLNMK